MTIFLSFCHAGGVAGRDRGALRALRTAPQGGVRVSGVYSCPSAAAGLSRVLGRRSAPGSGSNCGPGVRRPSSRGRGPDWGALERRPGTRGAEERPLPAEAEDCANTGVSAQLETPDAAAELPPSGREPAQAHRACAVPTPPSACAHNSSAPVRPSGGRGGVARCVCGSRPRVRPRIRRTLSSADVFGSVNTYANLNKRSLKNVCNTFRVETLRQAVLSSIELGARDRPRRLWLESQARNAGNQ